MPPPKTNTFSSVQVLRGLAALAVVVFHGALLAHDDKLGPVPAFDGGEGGVDLFFAISGFVMVASTAKVWGDRTFWRKFLLRRFIRIAPLYWIFTTLKAGMIVALPGMMKHSTLDWYLIVASFFFIPAFNPGQGHIAPVLPVGWTLNFEMLFYVFFTIGLAWFARPLRLLVPLLAALGILGAFRTDAWGNLSWYIDPLLIEFVFGMLIATAVRAKFVLPTVPAAILAVAMIAALCVYPFPYSYLNKSMAELDHARVLFRGIPAALLLYAVLSLEGTIRSWIAGLPVLIGDASYSIYLSHTFVIPPLGMICAKVFHHGVVGAYVLICACLLISTAVGILVHWYLEVPMLHFLNKRAHQPDPVGVRTTA